MSEMTYRLYCLIQVLALLLIFSASTLGDSDVLIEHAVSFLGYSLMYGMFWFWRKTVLLEWGVLAELEDERNQLEKELIAA